MKLAKGYVGGRGRLYRSARETVERAVVRVSRSADQKANLPRPMDHRIGAAAKINGLSYSQLIAGSKQAGVEFDRKVSAEIAVADAAGSNR